MNLNFARKKVFYLQRFYVFRWDKEGLLCHFWGVFFGKYEQKMVDK